VFMYRDIFARIAVPLIFGTVQLNPFNYVELTPVQLRIIQSEPEEIEAFLDQFSDVADIQYGLSELEHPFAGTELVVRLTGLARLQLHAAAAILTGGYDFRGAVQSALLASELALKSVAAANDLSESEIKTRFNHNTSKLLDFAVASWPSLDGDRLGRVIGAQPQYVPNRYAADQPDRREVGHIVMGTQFIVAEVVRQMSKRNFRQNLSKVFPRRYPV